MAQVLSTAQLGQAGFISDIAKGVQHLSGHHAVGTGGSAGLDRRDTAFGGKTGRLGNETEGLGLEGVAGQNGQRLAVDLVVGGLATAQIVVVHAGQVVVDKGIVVHQLQRAGIGQRQVPVDTAQTGKFRVSTGRIRLPPESTLYRMAS